MTDGHFHMYDYISAIPATWIYSIKSRVYLLQIIKVKQGQVQVHWYSTFQANCNIICDAHAVYISYDLI